MVKRRTSTGQLGDTRTFKVKASYFILIDNMLFHKSVVGPYLRCRRKNDVPTVLGELHDAECGDHSRGRSLSNKRLTMSYFWPTMRKDAMEYARKCDACQKHATIRDQHAEQLHQ